MSGLLPFGKYWSFFLIRNLEFRGVSHECHISRELQIINTPNFMINGSTDDLWPTILTLDHIGDLPETWVNSSCRLASAVNDNKCVSIGYSKLKIITRWRTQHRL